MAFDAVDEFFLIGSASPVVPKVPSFMWRPARPAIWPISSGRSGRMVWPSNLSSAANAT